MYNILRCPFSALGFLGGKQNKPREAGQNFTT